MNKMNTLPSMNVSLNDSDDDDDYYNGNVTNEEYVFDRTNVRAIFIVLYSLVFACCFLGNLLVILVVTLIRRLRTTTNFFLANLAVADLCVGIFCVFQNLTIYLIPSWVFGDFLCKMYQFVHSLSYTASIFILVVICTERYFAIMHPITCKQILTPTRLKLVIAIVWITSAIYSAPKFVYVQTISSTLRNGQNETICITHRQKYNSQIFDIINFVLLYVTPLCVMTFLYTIIGVRLWNSSISYCKPRKIEFSLHRTSNFRRKSASVAKKYDSTLPCESQVNFHNHSRKPSFQTTTCHRQEGRNSKITYRVSSSRNILRARRGVIRMLMIVVLTFAICNLPFHARKMWQYWSSGYEGGSTFSSLFTPLTFLLTYFNSGINPILYAFLSRNFRNGIRELLCCNLRSRKNQFQSNHHHNSSFVRKSGRES